MRRVLVAAAVCGLSGCMAHERRVESVPGAVRAERSPPLSGSERVYALLVPRMDQLEIRVRAESSCSVRQVRSVERTEIDTQRPTSGRFIGAAAAFIGGAILLSGKGSDALGATLVGGGAAIVVVPMLVEGEERRKLAPLRHVAPGAGAVPCGDRPVRDARVSVRLGSRTVEGKTDVAGRVRFRDEKGSAEMRVFVDDVAVPTRVGAPPTGTLPTSEAPARPEAPSTR